MGGPTKIVCECQYPGCGRKFETPRNASTRYCPLHKGGKVRDLPPEQLEELIIAMDDQNGLQLRLLELELQLAEVSTKLEESDINAMERTIANLRAQLQNAQKKVAEVQRNQTVTETVREAVREVASAFPPLPQVYIPNLTEKTHEQEAAVMLCCLHYGEVVSPGETGGFGIYNIAYAQARVQCVVDAIIDLVHDHHRGEHIRKLWVPNLGDNVSGIIHDELTITNERPIISQVLGAGFLLSLALRDLAAAFPEVEMIGLPGNHGRTSRKPAHKNKAEDSFDRMVYETAALLTSQIDNIKVTIPPSPFARVVINHIPFLFMHGDNLKAWNNIPFYGTYRANANFTTMFSTREEYYRYLGLGHFHQVAELPRMGGKILMTGSLKGPDEYSMDVLQTGSDAEQLFFGVHHKRGLSFRYPINAADSTPQTHDRYQFELADVPLADMAKKLGLL